MLVATIIICIVYVIIGRMEKKQKLVNEIMTARHEKIGFISVGDATAAREHFNTLNIKELKRVKANY